MYCELSDCNSPFPTPSFTLKKKEKDDATFYAEAPEITQKRDKTQESVFVCFSLLGVLSWCCCFFYFFLDNKSSPACSPLTVLYLHKLQLLIVSSSSLPWKVWFWFKSKDTTLARAVYQGVIRWIEGEGNSTFSVISLIFHMLRACHQNYVVPPKLFRTAVFITWIVHLHLTHRSPFVDTFSFAVP